MSNQITAEDIAEAKRKLARNRYMRERNKGLKQFRLKPDTSNRLKGMYEEYVRTCAMQWNVPANLQDFLIHFCELGYLEWRKKQYGNKDIL